MGRCSAVFYDFNGCMSLTCSRAGCGCVFCGWCLKDCGADAHAHVANECRKKPEGQDAYFGDVEVWKNVHRERQRGEILAHLATLPLAFQRRVVEACRQQLVDAGLGDLDVEAADAELAAAL